MSLYWYIATFKQKCKEDKVLFTLENPPTPPKLIQSEGHFYTWDDFVIEPRDIVVNAIDHQHKIKYHDESGELITTKDELDDPPPVPFKSGYIGSWSAPLYESAVESVYPRYEAIIYQVTFIDHLGSRVLPFTLDNFPDLNVRSNPGEYGKWEQFEILPQNLTIVAQYEMQIFHYVDRYDNNVATMLSSETPPDVPEIVGYVGKWRIPNGTQKEEIIRPKYTPILYKIEFVQPSGSKISVTFTINSIIKPPKIEKIPGFKWGVYDTSLPKNQCVKAIPIEIRFHIDSENTVTYKYSKTNSIKEPKIKGYIWPHFEIGFEDLDIYPDPDTFFALFYVDSKLKFCVPFNLLDHHYVKEMLDSDTVPILRGKHGVWKKIKSQFGNLIYSAVYSDSSQDFHNTRLSHEWELSKLPTVLLNDKYIELNNKKIDIFSTKFSKITGIMEY